MRANGGRKDLLMAVLLLAVLAGGASSCALFQKTSAVNTSPTTSSSSPPSDTTTLAPTTLAPSTSTSTTTVTTTTGPPSCESSSLSLSRGGTSGATGTIGLGVIIRNTGTSPCTLDGYPTLTLTPASGSVSPVFSVTGPSPSVVEIAGKGEAGFVVEYSDVQVNGETSCPEIVSMRVALPGSAGGPISMARRFFPCGSPNIEVSAVLPYSQYQSLVG